MNEENDSPGHIMAYIFIDDGYPDARDYDSNYIYYDPDDLDQMEKILALLEQRSKKRNQMNTPSRRILLNAIEKRRRSAFEYQKRELSRNISFAKKAQDIVERCFEAVSNSFRRSPALAVPSENDRNL